MRILFGSLMLLLIGDSSMAQDRAPILDMHLHALPADSQGPPPLAMCTPIPQMPAWDPAVPYGPEFMKLHKQPPCDDPIWSPETDEGVMNRTIDVVERLNVFGVLSGTVDRVAAWSEAAPGRFIPGILFNVAQTDVSPDSLRSLVESGAVQALGEVTNQYAGIAPDDERMEPYWALAEELDIPVGIHIGPGPPGVIYLGASGYRAHLHSALTLEPVLVRHPKLRVYVMHAGFPMIDDLLVLMYAHPQVYVGVGVIVYTRADFLPYLRRIVEAGHGNRVMFGSDQMVWPETIERSIDIIQSAPFLSDGQKRDILYNNAARFLRLSQDEIARHHDM
ncbi:MAG: amidohydrolase family protein [Rhodothermales bacterium]|nr:amidohydrolase family protein [Rhodothermales bacterium]